MKNMKDNIAGACHYRASLDRTSQDPSALFLHQDQQRGSCVTCAYGGHPSVISSGKQTRAEFHTLSVSLSDIT